MRCLAVGLFLSAALLVSGCMSAMNKAARSGDTKTLQKLIAAGHNVDEEQVGGYEGGVIPSSPLSIACSHQSLDSVKFLLSKGANPNYADRDGVTPLMALAWNGRVDIAKLLIAAGANPDQTDNQGRTALDRARIAAQSAALIRYLESVSRAGAVSPAMRAEAPVTAPGRAPLSAPAAPAALFPNFSTPSADDEFAVIVGIENYPDMPAATYAERDAAAYRRFVVAMGVPERNIMALSGARATKTGLEKALEAWLPNNVNEKSKVYFFYSGHGAPDIKTGDAYLVPADGDPQYLAQTGYPLKRLYAKLGELKAKSVLVALDSCFSGTGGRSVLAKGTRPLVSKVDTGGAPAKVTVLSASAGDQASGADDEAGYGLFTYNLLQGLNGAAKDAAGRITAESLYSYLKPRVQDAARRSNRDQTPQLQGGDGLVLRDR